ncbi:MAG TPA: hypothetical protein VKE74_08750 [Gemmataceae bacterium]|nr:hypothetical protein [Gemmataceae bacterium]
MISFDPTAFPIVRCPAASLEVGLFPVTRTQFDFFLGARSEFDPAALAEITEAAPRASWRTIPPESPEGVFLTAIRAEEAEQFARWLGGGFRLATDAEWRAIDAAIGGWPNVRLLRDLLADVRMHPAARAILNWSLARQPATWRTASLFEDGLLEWVRRASGAYGLQGRPRPTLIRLVHNPQAHEAVTPRTAARHPAFGFRIVRPWAPNPQVP